MYKDCNVDVLSLLCIVGFADGPAKPQDMGLQINLGLTGR
jgi:hypothetical protein